MATQNKFPTKMSRFFDTHGAGGITIQGVELDTGDDGFVEAPSGFAKEMAPHGFLLEGSKEHNDWLKTNPQPAKTAAGVGKR